METFSALLAICAGNSPVPGEFPAQRPVTRSFDVFFDLRLNKWFSKQSWGWWCETHSCPLWRHCNGVQNLFYALPNMVWYIAPRYNGSQQDMSFLLTNYLILEQWCVLTPIVFIALQIECWVIISYDFTQVQYFIHCVCSLCKKSGKYSTKMKTPQHRDIYIFVHLKLTNCVEHDHRAFHKCRGVRMIKIWHALPQRPPTGAQWFNIKMTFYQYRKSHCRDDTVTRSFDLHNKISYAGKMSSLYWISLKSGSSLLI